VSSTTELTGLVPEVRGLLFEADSESDSDSGQETGLWGTPPPYPWMYGLTVWAVCAIRTNCTLFSQKNNDKSNEVTWGFLNIRRNLGLVFHTIYSGIFHPCYLLLLFPLLHFPPLLSTPAFSTFTILPVSHFPLPHFQSPLVTLLFVKGLYRFTPNEFLAEIEEFQNKLPNICFFYNGVIVLLLI